MSYVSLYRRFRPDTFDKVIGQEHIVRTLKNQLKNDRIGHAYLFTGTRGTGKTSCAKIFARAVNCLSPIDGSPCNKCEMCRQLSFDTGIDLVEIDAASNNGVDEIRELKENAQYPPAVARYKVYIIDEVHMLSSSAFNALLKTLEEPPEFVIFILATTEVHKLPQTILSRCMRFDFRLVGVEALIGLIKRIFDELGVSYEERAIKKIAAAGEGSVRDSISVADTVLSYCDGDIAYKDVLEVLGAVDFDTLNALGNAILGGNTGEALRLTNKLFSMGRNALNRDLANYFCDLVSVKNTATDPSAVASDEEYNALFATAERFDNYRIMRSMEIICGLENTIRFSSQPKILLEAAIVKACEMRLDESIEGIGSRITEVEKKLSEVKRGGGLYEPPQPPQAVAPERVVTPKTEPRSITEVFSGLSKEVKSEVVFNDSENNSEDTRGIELWHKISEKLRIDGELMLAQLMKGIDRGFSISDRELILDCPSEADYNNLSKKAVKEKISEYVKRELGENYVFSVRFGSVVEESEELPKTLFDLFGGRLDLTKKK